MTGSIDLGDQLSSTFGLEASRSLLQITRVGSPGLERNETKLRMAVYVSNLARIGAKICENAFRTIPKNLFFDTENFFSRNIRIKKLIFANFARFRTTHGQTDVTNNSGIKILL